VSLGAASSVTPHSLAVVHYYLLACRHRPSFPTRRSSDLASDSRAPEKRATKQSCGSGDCPRIITRFAPHVQRRGRGCMCDANRVDRKSTRLNSSHVKISYAVCCLKKKRDVNHIRTYRSDR